MVPNRNAMEPGAQGVTDERKASLVDQILRGELTPQEACKLEGLSEPELKRWVRDYTRVARRAVDDQVAAALAAHGLEVDERPGTEFTGSLEGMGLPEVIQTIQYGKKDAHIRIDHDGEQSQLWCVQGDVVDACSALLTGSAAVYRILGIEHGRLHAAFSPVQRGRTIHASTQALLMEAAKRSDECRQIRQRLGDTQNIYVPSASAPPESEIEPDQAIVLRAFDGTRSIEQVVHDSEFPDLETLGMILRLFEQEWLVLEPFRSQKRAPPPQPERLSASSFQPLAASLASRLSWRPPRHRLWASAVAGAAVVAGAFAIGFYSAQPGKDSASVASPPAPSCGANLAPLPGGHCLERSEVTAGEYLACVRAGGCEPLQRELPVPATGGGLAAPGTDPPATTVAAGTTDDVTVTAGASATPAASAGDTSKTAATTPPSAATSPASELARSDAAAHCNAAVPGREGHSINCVTAQQARRYCEWRGGRLPTRAEWELAAEASHPQRSDLDLLGGLSEWTVDPGAGAESTRERYMVLGGGLDTTAANGGISRRHLNANAHGRSVGFRCAVPADAHPVRPLVAHREPATPEPRP